MQPLSEIQNLIEYDPKTGEFTWKLRDSSTKGGRIFNGKITANGNKAEQLYFKEWNRT